MEDKTLSENIKKALAVIFIICVAILSVGSCCFFIYWLGHKL
jgi:flagellar basal body-associated protein FliL